MELSEKQIEALAPDASSLKAGKSLSKPQQWLLKQHNHRAIWGEIKGNGSKPYRTQVDLQQLAFKCSCPSFKFPCKHGLGLLLAFASQATAFEADASEPDWVKEWLDKRQAKAEKEEKKAEQTPESTEANEAKAQKAKEKRQQQRLSQVETGIDELRLWLKDLVRVGLLDLPNKNTRFFDQVIARMVDAKATGLAAKIRALRELNYTNDAWQTQALGIIAETFLLLEAYRNLDKQNPVFQQNIKNLIGWSQSSKDLLQDEQAETIQDTWVALGHEEVETEGILTHRTWLWGLQSNRTALVLHFVTPYAPPPALIPIGHIFRAILAFFPAVVPQRAIIKQSLENVKTIPQLPQSCSSWEEALQYQSKATALLPLVSDLPVVVQQVRLMTHEQQLYLCDHTWRYLRLSASVVPKTLHKMFAHAGNNPVLLAGILRQDGFLPLGYFESNRYIFLAS